MARLAAAIDWDCRILTRTPELPDEAVPVVLAQVREMPRPEVPVEDDPSA